MPRDGTKNLIPLNKRTKEEQKVIVTQGGIASGIERNRRRTLKEELMLMLQDEELQKSITVALLKEAENGNTKAYEIVRDTVGEKPTDKIEQTTNMNINAYKELSIEELKKLAGG